ncbi:MAG: YceI family protein [Gammaproteobacteria bacterium]|nr:YceI family protein [Gammaproteobacteria bacterium]
MKNLKVIKFVAIIISTFLVSIMSAHAAEWVVDADKSQLNFISIKKEKIAEVHQFDKFQGQLDSQGKFELNIDLASVDTHIAVRDERMKKHFFNIDSFATATLTSAIDLSILDAIAQGASAPLVIDANLELHGEIKTVQLNVIITRLVGAKLSVVSTQPVIINVADFSLVSGVNKLMELAKLPSISHAVPVSFYLTLNLK